MKRFLSAALASALVFSAAAPAMAGPALTKGARAQKLTAQPMGHNSKAAARPMKFAAVSGTHHFGPVVKTKAQLAKSHKFMSAKIPTLKKKP
jgi:hypothetical protein